MTAAASQHRTDLDQLEQYMNAAWPALDVQEQDGWLLRSAGGVTQRANSVWPVLAPDDLAANLLATESWYAARRQPVIFQLVRRPENAGLEALLDARSYSSQSETLIMTSTVVGSAVAEITTSATTNRHSASGASMIDSESVTTDAEAAPSGPIGVTITISEQPSPDWLELWWSVDGRGGRTEMVMAQRILQGVPALYATAHDEQGEAVGTGRLALPGLVSSDDVTSSGGWAGIYSMTVHPQARRRGIATHILNALTTAGTERGVCNFWLMVTAANSAAQSLYERAGFTGQGRYHYRQAPLRRAPGGC